MSSERKVRIYNVSAKATVECGNETRVFKKRDTD